jgi:NAD-dependent epimerase/dehydratase family protein
MKLFVAGATGAVGKRLVPRLLAQGHDVVGMTRSPEKAESLRRLGAEAAVADGLDAAAVREAVAKAGPEVVIHQMTALTGVKSFRKFDDEFALSNRLRTEGTDHLLAAGRSAGSGASSRKATATGTTSAPGRDRRPRTTRSTPTRRRTSAARSMRFATSRRPSSRPRTWRGSRCATGTSTDRAPASPSTATSPSWFASAGCPSSATGPASGRLSISTMSPPLLSRQPSAGRPGSTTWSTMSRRRLPYGCRSTRERSALSRRGTSRSGSAVSRVARSASR